MNKKLLVVVDFQKDFVDGSLGFKEACAIEKPIADKIALYRQWGDEIAFTFDTHDENYLSTQEGRNLPVRHCVKDTEGFELFGEIAGLKQEKDRCFYKQSFGSPELFEYLKTNEFASIELVGLVSNICVLSNAVLAKTAQPETPVSVDASCIAGGDANLHNAAISVMKALQITII